MRNPMGRGAFVPLAFFAGALFAMPALSSSDGEAPKRSLRFAIDKDGLKWTGPCRASLFVAGQTGPEGLALEHADVSEPASLPAGRYDAVIACPSTEGDLSSTVAVDLSRRDAEARVKLRPAFLVVRVVRDGEEVPADIVISDAKGHEVQRGKDKVVLPVPPGKLTVLARLDKRVGGRPILGSLSVVTREGKKSSETVDTSDGTLVLSLTNNGRPAEGIGHLRMPHSRERLVEIESDQDVLVPPGTYELATQLSSSHDFSEAVKRNVTIRPGRVVKVRVDHRTGQLEPLLTRSGRPLGDDEDATVELFLGAAPTAFNTLAKGEVATLAPGRYRVKARLKGQQLDDGSPYEAEANATVSARGKARVKLDFGAADLEVVTQLGGEPSALDVAVFRSNADAPVVSRKADAKGAARFTLPEGSYRVTATLNAPQGLVLTETRVFLKEGPPTRKVLDLDVGRALVQVFQGGVAVSAEVLFFQEGAAAPLLSVAAGQEAYLPPGTYALAVRRGGATRSFAPIRVAAGRVAERQVELLARIQADEGEPTPAAASAAPPAPADEEMPDGEEP